MLDRNATITRTGGRRRWAAALLGLPLVLGLGPAGPSAAARPSLAGAQEGSGLGDPLFREQADGLRAWALVAVSAGSDRRPELAQRLDAMLETLVTAASCGVSAEAWQGAAPALALLEACIGAEPAERARLLRAAWGLAGMAPTPETERALARCSVRLAESLVHTLETTRPDTAEFDPSATLPGVPPRGELLGLLEVARAALDGPSAVPVPFVQRSAQRVDLFGIGGTVPRYVARDTAGNEVRSNDFGGKVTLYRVWDSASAASVRAHQLDAALARAFWDLPFEVVGISANDDRASHLGQLDELGLTDMGTQLYDGPISTELVDALARSGGAARTAASSSLDAWAQPEPGACILVDSKGVIRARGLGHGELVLWIPLLVQEHHLELRERSFTR